MVKKRFGVGSKSERDAVVLLTEDGELVLRREGGNAFFDPALEELVGHRIRGQGRRADYTLILRDWKIVGPAPPPKRGRKTRKAAS